MITCILGWQDCDGSGSLSAGWFLDSSKPSGSASSDLDEDSDCTYSGYVAGSGTVPPSGTSTDWTVYCDSASSTTIEAPCVDSASYTDAGCGDYCYEWSGYSCTTASCSLTSAEATELQEKCPNYCSVSGSIDYRARRLLNAHI